jgi:hypothetical protein
LEQRALAALAEMSAENGGTDEEWEAGVQLPAMDPQAVATSAEALFTFTVPTILRYHVNLTAMTSAGDEIALAGGRVGDEQLTPVYGCTAALAEHLGTEVFVFASGHIGCISLPRAFAQRLSKILGTDLAPSP